MPLNRTLSISSTKKPNWQTGFTLIEVMVAFVIMAVGLLGMASLQSTGLQVNRNAYHRTQAAFLAMDMAERMRTNRVEAVADQYINTGGLSDGTQNMACLTTTGCSSSDMVSNDIFEWQTKVAELLPSGNAVICVDSVPNDGTSNSDPLCDGLETSVEEPVYAIKIWWKNPFSDNTTDNQRHVASVTP